MEDQIRTEERKKFEKELFREKKLHEAQVRELLSQTSAEFETKREIDLARFETEKDEMRRNFEIEKEKWEADFESAVESKLKKIVAANKEQQALEISKTEQLLKKDFEIRLKEQANQNKKKVKVERDNFHQKVLEISNSIPGYVDKIQKELEIFKMFYKKAQEGLQWKFLVSLS